MRHARSDYNRPEVLRRFWAKVDRRGPNECWPWAGGQSSGGYGGFTVGQINVGAHQVAFVLARGDLEDGEWVCHRCDNPPCCNPAHLFRGDVVMNNADMVAKGRQRGPAKLDDEQVRQVRRLVHGGASQRAVARLFDVSQALVSHIVLGRRRGAVR